MIVPPIASNNTIAILIPMVWSVRNIVYSGILKSLAASGIEAHLLMPQCPVLGTALEQEWFASAVACHPLLRPQGRELRGQAFLNGSIQSAFNQLHQIESYPIYRRWLERNDKGLTQLRNNLIFATGKFARSQANVRQLVKRKERFYRRGRDLEPIREQLKQIAPKLIWSTICVSPLEYPYILAAQDLGVPVVTSILSFDNLTSRGWLPAYHHYLVWNERMAQQLQEFHTGFDFHHITVSGTPQFDFHVNPAYRWERKQTLATLGINANRRYFLYAGSAQTLTPDEPKLVAQLAQRMDTQTVFKDNALVVRLHPLDNWKRWERVCEVSKRVVISRPWSATPDQEGWVLSTPEDYARLISTIAHSEACLNIASTMTLDAAVLDRPVIGIDFAQEKDSPQDILYEEYGTHHYKTLVESKGLRVACSWEELFTLMHRAITDSSKDRTERAAMVASEVGIVDGRAAERVAVAIKKLMQI